MATDSTLNTVYITSRHYADLVESDTQLTALRIYLLKNLTAEKFYDGSIRVVFEGDIPEILSILFPSTYATESAKLIARFKAEEELNAKKNEGSDD